MSDRVRITGALFTSLALALACLHLGGYAVANMGKPAFLRPSYTVAVFGPECIHGVETTAFTHAEAPYSSASGIDMAHVHVYGLSAKVSQSCARLEVRHK